MKKELEVNNDTTQDQSGDKPNARNVQGKALQMNDNTAGGKKPAKSPVAPGAAEKPNARNVQGKALRVNENGAGE